MGPEETAAASESSGVPSGLPPWWRGPTAIDGLSAEAADVVRRIEKQLSRGGEATEVEVDDVSDLGEPPADAIPEALAAVHGLLDQALADGASLDEVATYRRRLLRLERSWSDVAVREEGAAYRQLLRDVSHDVRSPLNSILFLADGLLTEQNGSLNPVQRRQMGVVYSAAASLLNLVNDLLDFARTTSDEEEAVVHVPFSVENALSDVRHLLAPIADHHDTNFEFDVEVAGPRRGDPQALRRVLINLASNALEATPPGGKVLVTVSDESGGEELRVDVDDDGDGVDLERVRKLLRPQPETHATRMLRGRTHGLGLIICGRMVRTAEGELEVTHLDDGGSRFTLRLPFPRI